MVRVSVEGEARGKVEEDTGGNIERDGIGVSRG